MKLPTGYVQIRMWPRFPPQQALLSVYCLAESRTQRRFIWFLVCLLCQDSPKFFYMKGSIQKNVFCFFRCSFWVRFWASL